MVKSKRKAGRSYPYKLYYKNPLEERLFDELNKFNRSVNAVPDNISKSLGWRIRPVRGDIRLLQDKYDKVTVLIKDPCIKMEKRKTHYVLKKLF
jgi:hypothetical protein